MSHFITLNLYVISNSNKLYVILAFKVYFLFLASFPIFKYVETFVVDVMTIINKYLMLQKVLIGL